MNKINNHIKKLGLHLVVSTFFRIFANVINLILTIKKKNYVLFHEKRFVFLF